MPSPDESGPRRGWAALPWVELGGLVLAALFALWFQLSLPSRLASEEDYRALGQALEAEAAPGDVVLLYPWWTERARLFIPERVPVVGYLGSDKDPLTAHPRVWVISQPSLPKSDLAKLERDFLPGRTRLGEARRFGRLELSVFRNGRHRPALFSATDAFASARVYVEGPSGRTDCPFDGRAHRCPVGGLYVAPELHEIDFQPRRCLWMKPPGGPARLVAELGQVPAGESLVLEGGVVGELAAHKDRALTPARIGVEDAASGRALLELVIPPGLEGVQRASVAPPGGAAPLRLWVQSDSPERRETCVELFSYGPALAGAGAL